MKRWNKKRLGNRLHGTLANPVWSILPAFLFFYGFTYQPGDVHIGKASWYSTEACQVWENRGVYDCPTASGKSLYSLEQTKTDFAAMWDIPFGSRVRVTNQANGKFVVVTIYDRGPARRLGRIIDLSKSSFEKIANPKQGIIDVKIEVLKTGGVK